MRHTTTKTWLERLLKRYCENASELKEQANDEPTPRHRWSILVKKLDKGLVIAWAVVAESAIKVLMPVFYGNFAIDSKFVDGTLTQELRGSGGLPR